MNETFLIRPTATDPVPVARGPLRLGIVVNQWVTVARSSQVRRWTVELIGYRYEIVAPDDRELLAFHWHPTGNSPVTAPHLHVGMTAPFDMTKAHVPSGPVTLPELIRFALAELGAEPLRDDWQTVLA